MDVAADKLELDEIQGNILAGFKNEFITFLFLKLSGDGRKARAWLADVIADVATTTEVKTFNDLFRLAQSLRRRNTPESVVDEPGPHARAACERSASTTPSSTNCRRSSRRGCGRAPRSSATPATTRQRNGQTASASAAIDALMIVADDDAAHRNTKVDDFLVRASTRGATVVLRVHGMRRERRGSSSISATGTASHSRPSSASRTTERPIWNWRKPVPMTSPETSSRVNSFSGIRASPHPRAPRRAIRRTRNPRGSRTGHSSSSAVCGRTSPASTSSSAKAAVTANMTEELFRAKLVGRYRSGVPLVGMNQSEVDPGTRDPALLERGKINDFTYDKRP